MKRIMRLRLRAESAPVRQSRRHAGGSGARPA